MWNVHEGDPLRHFLLSYSRDLALGFTPLNIANMSNEGDPLRHLSKVMVMFKG
jgi:hypothetical protein